MSEDTTENPTYAPNTTQGEGLHAWEGPQYLISRWRESPSGDRLCFQARNGSHEESFYLSRQSIQELANMAEGFLAGRDEATRTIALCCAQGER